MAAPLESAALESAFAWTLLATLQTSILVLLILTTRALLRHRLAPHSRFALWLLLPLPLIAPLFPALPIPLPRPQPAPPTATPAQSLPTAAPAPTGWRVAYGPLPVQLPTTPAHLPRPQPTNWLRLAAIAWAAGLAVLALRVLVTHARAVRRAARHPSINDPHVLALLRQCCRAAGTRRVPRLVLSPGATSPALLGLLRPRLLLPEDTLRRLTPAELRFVFLHELVHLRRGDVLSEWLLTALQLLHWFNPLVWLAAARCRADREIACDAAVVALSGENTRADYGRTILALATSLAARPRLAGALGILETRSPLEQRLRMLARTPVGHPSRLTAACGFALLASLSVALVACTNPAPPAPPGHPAPPTAPAADAKPQAARPTRAEVPPTRPDILNARDRTVAEEKRDDPKNAAVRAKLDTVLPELNFDATPFTDVVDFLRDVSGANIFVNWNALKAAGVERNAPVTARLRDVRFSKALTVILDSLPPGRAPLGYSIDDGVITVSTAEDLQHDTITRVYDVRDLIIPIPDYEPAPTLDMQADPPPKPDAKPQAEWQPDDPGARERARIEADHADMRTRQELIDELVRLITETVDPRSWRDAGGTTGAVRELQGQLIVTQTPENHVGVRALLEQLRQARGVQISLEAKFVSIDDAVLAALPADLRATVEGELRAAKEPVPADREPQAAVPTPDDPDMKRPSRLALLSAAQVDQLMRATRASDQSTVITAPRITLFNGQAAYVLTATHRNYTADYVTIKNNDGSTRYEPKIGTASAGVVLAARATAGADRKFATISLRPRLTQLAGIDKVPWDRSPPDVKLTVERPRVLASELATTASIPDGQTLLMGGLKAYLGPDGRLAGEDARLAAGPTSHVIVLVKPKLIIQREIEAGVGADLDSRPRKPQSK